MDAVIIPLNFVVECLRAGQHVVCACSALLGETNGVPLRGIAQRLNVSSTLRNERRCAALRAG